MAKTRIRAVALASVGSRSRISLEEASGTAPAALEELLKTRSLVVVVKAVRLRVWEAGSAAATLALAKAESVDSKQLV